MGIALKANMITALILVGFAFGGQPLIGYNYGAKNQKRLKEILKFAYALEIGLGLGFTVLMSVFAPVIMGFFMEDQDIIVIGARMLRYQQTGNTVRNRIADIVKGIWIYGRIGFSGVRRCGDGRSGSLHCLENYEEREPLRF